MNEFLNELIGMKIDWTETSESPYIFQAISNDKVIKLRLNDFPEEPLCTLIFAGQQIDLEDFPALWTLPRHRQSSA
ncbi:MAG: hypothetical protein IPO00_03560 [Betaproteobacteria bacterium]|nr:hypothetical protein [Betaproteobacteria bacterium]